MSVLPSSNTCSQMKYSVAMRTSTYIFTTLLVCALIGYPSAEAFVLHRQTSLEQSYYGNPCSPANSQLTCIVGCFKCAQAFGRRLYHTRSCCTECQRTQARSVDNGPEHCSAEFFTDNLKDFAQEGRFILGKRD